MLHKASKIMQKLSQYTDIVTIWNKIMRFKPLPFFQQHLN